MELIGNAEDLVCTALDPGNPAMRHLGHYVDFLLESDDIEDESAQSNSIATVILDLVALTLGARREVAEVARFRGLRAVRIKEILSEIRNRFADPAFGPGVLAIKLGLSSRYIQALLHETGASFTERVLELRLQKARTMLMSHSHNRLKVSEIAYACGFGEVSYFNQAFRRRFGAAPTQFRGPNGRDRD